VEATLASTEAVVVFVVFPWLPSRARMS